MKLLNICKNIIEKYINDIEQKVGDMDETPCSHYEVKIGNIIFTYHNFFKNPNCLSTYKVWRIKFLNSGIVIISHNNWQYINTIYYNIMILSYFPDSKSYQLIVLVDETNFISNNYRYLDNKYIVYTNYYLDVFGKIIYNYQFQKNLSDKDNMYLSFSKSRAKNMNSFLSYCSTLYPNTIEKHKNLCDNFGYKQYHSISTIHNEIYEALNLYDFGN